MNATLPLNSLNEYFWKLFSVIILDFDEFLNKKQKLASMKF